MKKMHLLCGVTLLVAASAAFAADAKMEKKDAPAATAAKGPDMHHRGRPFVVRGNTGFHYGDHLNTFTMQSRGTPKPAEAK